MKNNILMEKSFCFSIRIVNLCKVLNKRNEFTLSKQLLRSGTGIGALIKESEHAQSKADFINKLNITLKEANETEYWIMLLKQTGYITSKEYNSIVDDCKELIRLLISIIKTSKSKYGK